MKKLLITGNAGFILGNFVRRLVYDKKPYKISSIDRISANALNNLYWNKNHSFHIADIRDEHIIDVIFQYEQPDIVLHGAALTHVDTSLKDPNSFISSNILGTQNIINACIKHKVEKLVYTSTDEVYGQLTSENDPLWTEEAPLNPRNPYSATKAAGELLVKAASQSHGLIYNITRGSNCYGARQLPEKLVPKTIKSIMEGQKIPLYGKGLQIRDWTHVNDHCSALMTVLEKGAPNNIYNISANQEFTNLETVQEVCNAMKQGHSLIDFIEDPRGGGHDFRYAINSSKIRELGWKPTFKFKEGMAETVEWYQLNKYFLK